jgi:hypothetical protein
MFHRQFIGAVAALLMVAPGLANAATPESDLAGGSRVTAVQPPAWLVQGALAIPVKPGTRVEDGDNLRTGPGARVYIELPEHSTVKLGENTEFAAPAMDMMHDEQGTMFKGVLHVLKGVFRFTTSLIGKSERRRVNIQVGAATIGIRGTDVWGRTNEDGSLVALLEGEAEMNMPGRATMMMEQPMHYMMMPAGGEMKMNMPVTQEKVAEWAAETNVRQGAGVLTIGGHWTVALASSADPRDTARLMKKLADAGYPAEDALATMGGRERHRLVIRQAATYEDARALASSIGGQYPSLKPRVLPLEQ